MAVLNFSFNLSEALRAELAAACEMCECSPAQFTKQALESALASRRLPKVPGGTIGPRIGARERHEPEDLGETRSSLAPGDIPTLEDLTCLEEL